MTVNLTPMETTYFRIIPGKGGIAVACANHHVDVCGPDFFSPNGLCPVYNVLFTALLPDGNLAAVGKEMEKAYAAYHTHWLESHHIELDIALRRTTPRSQAERIGRKGPDS